MQKLTARIDFRHLGIVLLIAISAIWHSDGYSETAAVCRAKPNIDAGDERFSVTVDGKKRNFLVHIPTHYKPDRPTPMVLVFHGGLGTGKNIKKQSRMDEVADREGFLGVYPDGLFRTWNAGGCCEEAMRRNIKDVAFVSTIIDRMEKDFCIDKRRIYATGFSNGAMMAHRLACELSERIAAIAPVSGVIMMSQCVPERPMPVMVLHGTKDPRSLWEGGLGDKDPSKGVRDSIPETMRKLYTRYGCPAREQTTFKRGAVACVSREPCRGGSEVTLCKISGGGHQWPGGEAVWPNKLGPLNRDVSASDLMWQFFKRHPMPEE